MRGRLLEGWGTLGRFRKKFYGLGAAARSRVCTLRNFFYIICMRTLRFAAQPGALPDEGPAHKGVRLEPTRRVDGHAPSHPACCLSKRPSDRMYTASIVIFTQAPCTAQAPVANNVCNRCDGRSKRSHFERCDAGRLGTHQTIDFTPEVRLPSCTSVGCWQRCSAPHPRHHPPLTVGDASALAWSELVAAPCRACDNVGSLDLRLMR